MILLDIDKLEKYVKFPQNIRASEHNLNLIENAYTSALKEHFFCDFSKEMIFDIDENKGNIYEWDSTTIRVPGDFVEYRTDIYEVINPTGAKPSISDPDYKKSELLTFYNNYLAPAFALCVYYKFIPYLNMNVSKDHLQSIVSETSTIVDSAQKGDFLSNWRTKWLNAYNTAISVNVRNNGTYDGVQYRFNRKRIKPIIKAVKQVRYGCCTN